MAGVVRINHLGVSRPHRATIDNGHRKHGMTAVSQFHTRPLGRVGPEFDKWMKSGHSHGECMAWSMKPWTNTGDRMKRNWANLDHFQFETRGEETPWRLEVGLPKITPPGPSLALWIS